MFMVMRCTAQDPTSATTHPPSTQSPSTQAPLTLTLQDALKLARSNSVEFLSAQTDRALAHEDQVQARAALLPKVDYNNQFLYTQGTGFVTQNLNVTGAAVATPRFIANNAVHEYISQGIVEQSLGYTQDCGLSPDTGAGSGSAGESRSRGKGVGGGRGAGLLRTNRRPA